MKVISITEHIRSYLHEHHVHQELSKLDVNKYILHHIQ